MVIIGAFWGGPADGARWELSDHPTGQQVIYEHRLSTAGEIIWTHRHCYRLVCEGEGILLFEYDGPEEARK